MWTIPLNRRSEGPEPEHSSSLLTCFLHVRVIFCFRRFHRSFFKYVLSLLSENHLSHFCFPYFQQMLRLVSHPAGKLPLIPISLWGEVLKGGGGSRLQATPHQCHVIMSEIMSAGMRYRDVALRVFVRHGDARWFLPPAARRSNVKYEVMLLFRFQGEITGLPNSWWCIYRQIRWVFVYTPSLSFLPPPSTVEGDGN